MATRANSHARMVEAVTQPASMRRFADLSMAALLGGLVFGSATGSAAGGPADAVRICGERAMRCSSSSRCSMTRSRRRWALVPTAA
jgi:hypothetical protein